MCNEILINIFRVTSLWTSNCGDIWAANLAALKCEFGHLKLYDLQFNSVDIPVNNGKRLSYAETSINIQIYC